jgi:Terminase large subunit, T4likevirus-type, N-terminal
MAATKKRPPEKRPAKTPARRIGPNSPPQEAFLASNADIAIYGGAAGGGKSWALLMEAMRHTSNPDFGAVLFRRLSPQITNEGGLWDEAGRVYPLAGAVARVGDLEWTFPPGGRVTMRHLQHESTKYGWQGAQVPLLGFDELTHFSESQFWYMISRNRSTCGIRPYIRAGCNADASSWVKRFIAPWVDRKHALYPTPAGAILWLVRLKGEYHWYPTRRAAIAANSPETIPKSVTFVRATVHDNVDLLRTNPEYLGNLQAQSEVERARLLDGDWDKLNEGTVYPDFGMAVVEEEDWPKDLGWFTHGGIDWGWHNPFGALAGYLDGDDVLWVSWERYGSYITLTEHSKALPRGEIRWWCDPAGADQIAEIHHGGHDAVSCVHLGQKPLDNGINAVTERIRTGRLKVRGDLCELIDESKKYIRDPHRLDGRPLDKDNHLLAALRYMIVGIDRLRVVKDASGDSSPIDPNARLAEAAARAALETAHRDPDNGHWWPDD